LKIATAKINKTFFVVTTFIHDFHMRIEIMSMNLENRSLDVA
jgi:hypothetical protein